MKIFKYSNPKERKILIKQAKAVAILEEDYKTIKNMKKALKGTGGVGISAPQIGESKAISIVLPKTYKAILNIDQSLSHKEKVEKINKTANNEIENDPLILINPKIRLKSEETEKRKESCLSLDGVYEVERPKEIRVTYRNKNRERLVRVFDSPTSRVVQHEIDHLKGTLISDK